MYLFERQRAKERRTERRGEDERKGGEKGSTKAGGKEETFHSLVYFPNGCSSKG